MAEQVVIIGGGLAGLITSLHLRQHGISCTIIERNHYPFHRVCGEYVSNEVVDYLKNLGAFPEILGPSQIRIFHLTSVTGRSATLPLDLGGFGISRYAFDHHLFRLAQQRGVRFQLDTEATHVHLDNDHFVVETDHGSLEAEAVVGSFGKRSRLDKTLNRQFITRRSPYVGVKYHIRLPNFPTDVIALHNFSLGYCGVSAVENETVNLCYLTHRDNIRNFGKLQSMEEAVLCKNPALAEIFRQATFLFKSPETINEISFESKSPVEDHILMCGDSAGMISPLCGNGMAMAIHSAKMLSEHLVRFFNSDCTRKELEENYAAAWKKEFAFRLWAGRNIQRLFGSNFASQSAVFMANHLKPVAYRLMKMTHGKPF